MNQNKIVNGVDSNKYSSYTGNVNDINNFYGVNRGSSYSNYSDAEIETLKGALKAANDKLAADQTLLDSANADLQTTMSDVSATNDNINAYNQLEWGRTIVAGNTTDGTAVASNNRNYGDATGEHADKNAGAAAHFNDLMTNVKAKYVKIQGLKGRITADNTAINSAQDALNAAQKANALQATDPALIAAKAAADTAAAKAQSDSDAAKRLSETTAAAASSAASTKKFIYMGLGLIAIIGIGAVAVIMIKALERKEAKVGA